MTYQVTTSFFDMSSQRRYRFVAPQIDYVQEMLVAAQGHGKSEALS